MSYSAFALELKQGGEVEGRVENNFRTDAGHMLLTRHM